MVNAIGGRETAATGTIEIVRVTPVGIGKAPSCQGADCGPQPGGPAPAAVQPIGHRDAENHGARDMGGRMVRRPDPMGAGRTAVSAPFATFQT